MSELITRNKLRNRELKIHNVESVSNQSGLIKQTEQFNNYSVASKDLSNYYIINQGYFVYNPSRINVGSIAYKQDQQPSLVSSLYVSFSTSNAINDAYFLEWFKTTDFKAQLHRFSEGSVREMLPFNQLAEMNFKHGSYKEQESVASLLKLIEKKINVAQRKIDKLTKLNKYLLHKMIL